MARRNYVELERDARRGRLSYRTVTLYLNKGWVSAAEARELNRLIAEYELEQQRIAAAAAPAAPAGVAPVVVPGMLYTCRKCVQNFLDLNVDGTDEVKRLRDETPDWDTFGGRWPSEPRVTKDLDLFGVRILNEIIFRLYDDVKESVIQATGDETAAKEQALDEVMPIFAEFSYMDWLRCAGMVAHVKRTQQLAGAFNTGRLTAAMVDKAIPKGLGGPLTLFDADALRHTAAGEIVKHYEFMAAIIASFRELEKELSAKSREGALTIEDVQELKESGKLVQWDSPWAYEDSHEARRLREAIGEAEWRFLNPFVLGPNDEELRLFIRDHRTNGQPTLPLLVAQLPTVDIVLAWQLFGGWPDPAAPPPVRDRGDVRNSVAYSEHTALHFATTWFGIPVETVRRFFVSHKDLADEILLRQSMAKSLWRRLWGLGTEEQKTPFFVDLAAGTILPLLAGAVGGFAIATLLRLHRTILWPLWFGFGVLGAAALWAIFALLRRIRIGNIPRMGVVFPMVASVLILLLACGACQSVIRSDTAAEGARLLEYLR